MLSLTSKLWSASTHVLATPTLLISLFTPYIFNDITLSLFDLLHIVPRNK